MASCAETATERRQNGIDRLPVRHADVYFAVLWVGFWIALPLGPGSNNGFCHPVFYPATGFL